MLVATAGKIPANPPADLPTALARKEAAQAELALAQARALEAETRSVRDSAPLYVSESNFDLVNRWEWLPEMMQFRGMQFGGLAPAFAATNLDDRAGGRDRPFMENEHDSAQAAGLARWITETQCPSWAARENLESYIIGQGFTFKADSKKGEPPPMGLVDAVQKVIDHFLDDNSFKCDLDLELFWRSRRDGEFFETYHPGPDGITILRTIERDQIAEPSYAPPPPGWFRDNYGVDIADGEITNWKFGVHKSTRDAEQVYGYCVQWDQNDFQYIPADFVEHFKENVDRNIARGRTDFYPAWRWLNLQSRLLENTGEGAAEQAAVAYIIKHSKATRTQVQAMMDARGDLVMDMPALGGFGATPLRMHKRQPGTALRIGTDQEYTPGPMGADRGVAFIEVVQAILRQVAARWCLSEGQISADDSNNNMASQVVAGSRFWAYGKKSQARIGNRFLAMIWRAIYFAYCAGAFQRFGLTWAQLEQLIEITATAPEIEQRNQEEKERILESRLRNRVITLERYQTEVGVDPRVESPTTPAVPGAPPVPGQPAGPAAAAGVDSVQDTALNGAQVTSMVEVVGAVTAGTMPVDTAAGVLRVAFPQIDQQELEAIISPLRALRPAAAAGGPTAPGAPPAESPAASGEFMNISALQQNRNFNQTLRILNRVRTGDVTPAVGKEMLMAIGYAEARADALLADAQDGTVDGVDLASAANEAVLQLSIPGARLAWEGAGYP